MPTGRGQTDPLTLVPSLGNITCRERSTSKPLGWVLHNKHSSWINTVQANNYLCDNKNSSDIDTRRHP